MRFMRWDADLASGKKTSAQIQEEMQYLGAAGTAGAIVAFEIFVTKGKLAQLFGGLQLLNAISSDHAASNIKGESPEKERLQNEASEGYKSAAKDFIVGKAIGVGGRLASKAMRETKKWFKITEENIENPLNKMDEVLTDGTGYNVQMYRGEKPVTLGKSYMDERGILNFDIEVPSDFQKQGIAGEIFKRAIKKYDPIAIEGTWLPSSTNYKEYKKLINQGISPDKAVLMTPTGKLAAKNGFSGTPHVNRDNQSGVQAVFNKSN